MKKVILFSFLIMFLGAAGTAAATCNPPTGTITADKTIMDPGEKVKIRVTGYDDNDVLYLWLSYYDENDVWHEERHKCAWEQKSCYEDWNIKLKGEGAYTFYGKVTDSDYEKKYGCSVSTGQDSESFSIVITVGCVPDGCNNNCPEKCFVNEDPDCGCVGGNNCCPPMCTHENDSDCQAPPSSSEGSGISDDDSSDSVTCTSPKVCYGGNSCSELGGGDWVETSGTCSNPNYICCVERSSSDTPGNSGGTAGSGGIDNPLKYDNFKDLASAINNFIFTLAIAIAPILFVIGGLMIVTAGGNPAQVQKAQKMMLYTAIGLALILLAQAFVAVLRNVIGVKESATYLPLFFSTLGLKLNKIKGRLTLK